MPGVDVKTWLLQVWKDRPRRRRLVVTDITRMDGDRVCVAGYLEDGATVRPVCGRSGPTERWLIPAPDARVIPFSILDLKVERAPKRLLAPHVEDRIVPAKGHRVAGALNDAERQDWLESAAFPSVRAIFGAEVHADPQGKWGRYVKLGDGVRSLGTIRASWILAVRYQHYPERGRWDYRLRFRDDSGEEFQLAVVDLAFRRRLDELRDGGLLPEHVAATVLKELHRRAVYLRIGLARGWERHPDRCYLQITGVYGFPH